MLSIDNELKKYILKIKSDMNNLKNTNYKLINEHLELQLKFKKIKNDIHLNHSTIKEFQEKINKLK